MEYCYKFMESDVIRYKHNWLQQLWLLVVKNADFLSHLRTMKDFFLLGRGELFLTFIDKANLMLSVPLSRSTHHGVFSALVSFAIN